MMAIVNSSDSCIYKPRSVRGTGIGRILVVLFLLYGAAASGTEKIYIRSGNVAALQEAIEQANAGAEQYLLSVGGTFEFEENQSLPPIAGDMVIRRFTDRAVFRPADENASPDQLIRVEPGGRLVMHDLKIEGFRLSSSQEDHDGPLIENRGELLLRKMRFERLYGNSASGSAAGSSSVQNDADPVIGNHADLRIVTTTFLDVGVEGFQGGILVNHAGTVQLLAVLTASQDLDSGNRVAVANRGGRVRIINATLAAREHALITENGAVSEMVNTIVADLLYAGPSGSEEPDACIGPVVSLGHNLVRDTSCKLDGPEDIEDVPTGTLPLRLINRDRNPPAGVLVPVIGLAGASPAVDSADPAFCGNRDILSRNPGTDGNNDGVPQCDRGAVELVQEPLIDGGINGLYFVPEQDGHYITVLDTPNE